VRAVVAIELVAVHPLLPWEIIRLVADILGLWGLVWMLGLLASLSVHPHLVADAGLRVRHGARRGTETVTTIRFCADDARGLAARVRERLAARQGS
jgi:hypothetical protein